MIALYKHPAGETTQFLDGMHGDRARIEIRVVPVSAAPARGDDGGAVASGADRMNEPFEARHFGVLRAHVSNDRTDHELEYDLCLPVWQGE